MDVLRKPLDLRSGPLPFLLLLSLVLPTPAQAAHRRSVSVGMTIGGYFGAPAYVSGGFFYPAYYPDGVYVQSPRQPYYAFVDTDIHPEEAQVFVNGRLVGTADDFDGYPGYLALRPGQYTLGFTLVGHRSLSLDLDLRPGEMADLDRTLPTLAPGERDPGLPPVPSKGARPEKADPGPSNGHGTLRLQVRPPEARVVLDGSFFGTGKEISRLHSGIPLSPGIHRIRVSCEGYDSQSSEVRISRSTDQTLEIHLDRR